MAVFYGVHWKRLLLKGYPVTKLLGIDYDGGFVTWTFELELQISGFERTGGGRKQLVSHVELYVWFGCLMKANVFQYLSLTFHHFDMFYICKHC